MTPPGWYPCPNGAPELWYWDGRQWADDPIAEIEQRVADMVTPHLEAMFRQGFEHGIAYNGKGLK